MKSRKGGRARTHAVPMNGEVFEVLSRRDATKHSEWVFPNRDGKGPLSDHEKTFRHACERGAIKYGLLTGGLIFNDARRTSENRMLEARHSPCTVCEIMGHSIETMAGRSRPRNRVDKFWTLIGAVLRNLRKVERRKKP